MKTLETGGEPGKRMKRADIGAKQRKAGGTSGAAPPPLGEGSETSKAGPESPRQPGSMQSTKGKTLKVPSPGERMKAAFLQAKKAAITEQPTRQDQQEDLSGQATQQVRKAVKRAADPVVHRVERSGLERLSQVKPRVEQARESLRVLSHINISTHTQ